MHMTPKICIASLVHQLQIPASMAIRYSQVVSEVPKERPRDYVVLVSVAGVNNLPASPYMDATSVLIPLRRCPQRLSCVAVPPLTHLTMLPVAREAAKHRSGT